MPSRFTEIGRESTEAVEAARSWFSELPELNVWRVLPDWAVLPQWLQHERLAPALLWIACALLTVREILVHVRTRHFVSAYGHAHAD